MLTPFDEYPVHQAPYPVSYVPASDYSWDNGYFFAFMNPQEKIFAALGMRINPNTDMIGGYAFINIAGIQRTARFSRVWRPDFALRIGPIGFDILEPYRRIRVFAEPNESGLSFDVLWEGASPPLLEEHHIAMTRMRRTTDLTRYSQPGSVTGVLRLDSREWQVEPTTWAGARDHSWGIYAERPPLGPPSDLLPPRRQEGAARALRLWAVFRAGDVSGVFHLHEDSEGNQGKLNDVHGTPFGGRLHRGWDDPVDLVSGGHRIRYQPGTRIARHVLMTLVDDRGGTWSLDIDLPTPPWLPATIGYTPGSWTDGGTFHTYHGSETLAQEWDEFDFSQQPLVHKPYQVNGDAARDGFGMGFDVSRPVSGVEYLGDFTVTAPDGQTHRGAGHLEHFLVGAYHPYGFTAD